MSGDLKLKLWKYMEGLEISDMSIPSQGYKLYTKIIDDTSSIAAILYYNFMEIQFYKITDKFELLQEYVFKDKILSGTFGESSDQFYINLLNNSNRINILKLSHNIHSTMIEENMSKIINTCGIIFNHPIASDLDLMFKKKFDNVKKYQDRKKRRIENNK